MSSLTKKEFAKKCGITTRELAVYIKREHVILTKGKIDATLPENNEFMQKKIDKGESKEIKIIVKKSPETKEEKEEFDRKVNEADKRSIENDKRSKINSRIKELEIEKTEEEIEILRAKREKLEAFLIPIDIVKQIFAQHSKSITVSFQQGGENLLIEISKKKS